MATQMQLEVILAGKRIATTTKKAINGKRKYVSVSVFSKVLSLE